MVRPIACASVALVAALVLAGGVRPDTVTQTALVSDTSAPGWDYATGEVTYKGMNQPGNTVAVLAGSGCVHKILITPQFSNASEWTFYDASKIDDPAARKIASFYVTPGQTFEMPLDVRVRRGLVFTVGNTSAMVTVLHQAD